MADELLRQLDPVASNFNFRVTLRKSGEAATGAQNGPAAANADQAPGQGPDQPPDVLGDGGFQECTGLQVEMDVQEHQEGGRNDGIVRMVGRGKYQEIVLKRGMIYKRNRVLPEFWKWIQSTLAGEFPITRYDGVIELLDNRGELLAGNPTTLATWVFSRGLPSRLRGPDLNAKSGDVAIEELAIAHEGLRLEVAP